MKFSLVCVILAALLSGCGHGPSKIKIPGVGTVIGLTDQGKPAEIERTETTTSIEIPAGSEIVSEPETPVRVVLKQATVLTSTTTSTSATTGTVDSAVAQHRIDKEQETVLARHRMTIGIALILVGAVVAFALPTALRWPLPGICAAGVGLVLVMMPTPPPWLIPGLIVAGVITVVVFYIVKHQDKD